MIVAHFADLHYCPKHLEQVDKCFGYAVEHAIRSGAQLAVIAGDSFDASMGIHEPAFSVYLSRVMQLADEMPVVVLQGTFSHDRLGNLEAIKLLRANFPILVADTPGCYVYIIDKDFPGNIDGKPCWRPAEVFLQVNDTALCCVNVLPSLNKADLRMAYHPNGPGGYVTDLLVSWSATNTACRAEGIPTILAAHGTVNGSVTESKHAMVSPDHEFSMETLFTAGTSAVMLGHIHAHQSWQDNGRVAAYSGSIARLVHGHDGPVGYLLWDVMEAGSFCELVPTPARQLVDVTFDDLPDIAELRGLPLDGAHVRLRYSVDQNEAHAVDKDALRQALIEAGAADVKIEPSVYPTQSVRSPGIGRALGLMEKVAHWAKTTGDEDRVQGLRDRLARLQAEEPEQIVARLVQEDAECSRSA